MSLTLRAHAVTHIGLVHHENEDSWATFDADDGSVVWLVCDGMGGMGRGAEASQFAVRALTERWRGGLVGPSEALRDGLSAIDVSLREALCGDGRGLPGTTAVAAVWRDGEAVVGWVGDSRAYWVRDGAVRARTRDHKLVEELVALGQLSPEEAKTSPLAHVVTRGIGGRSAREPAVEASVLDPWSLRPGDRVVLCSDGLCDLADDAEVAAGASGRSPRAAAEHLLQLALDRGGHDNITIVVLEAHDADAATDEPADPQPDALLATLKEALPWLLLGATLGAVAVVGAALALRA